MKTCPNCQKRLNENFTYCNECGSRADGEIVGNFLTSLLNVFQIDDEYMYVFSVHGRQVVLKADTIEELKELVRLNKFPWMELEENILNSGASLMDVSSKSSC